MVFYFIILWKVNYVCLELTKINLSSGTGPCIYQNIGGEGGIVKLKEEKLQRKILPFDQNYCPLIYTCQIYSIS